jgi:hypothetical protein
METLPPGIDRVNAALALLATEAAHPLDLKLPDDPAENHAIKINAKAVLEATDAALTAEDEAFQQRKLRVLSLLRQIEVQKEKLGIAQGQQADYRQHVLDEEKEIHAVIGLTRHEWNFFDRSLNLDDWMNGTSLKDGYPIHRSNLKHAKYYLGFIDSWIEKQEAKIASLESDALREAKQLNLTNILPPDIAARAAA